ncbi:hypothetical protein D3273_12775 [Lichenibacterium minor]|uniref:PepSY domain-containing protein n=1 Tax=Lichenibacterium minor TaxID=2316528 RepID=A0A4V1RUK9_9HYPH|nr:hypothetical protein [Lichenibacterium minor]RYC31514.1 hypothetical protein D3273_12775 [Lichenibacterium minor]
MTRAALILAVLASSCGAAVAQGPPDDAQPLACVRPARARELFFEKGLVPPIRALREASNLGNAEAIDIQLCWFRGELVYDVTLLGRDGPVTHRLVAAATGAPLGEHPNP